MRIEPLLVHRCDLIRGSGEPIGKDPYGRPIYGDSTEENIPCRLDQIRERLASDDTGQDIILTNMIFLSPKNKPTYDMKVENIRDREGNILVDGSFRVTNIHPSYRLVHLHHYEVLLTREGVENA